MIIDYSEPSYLKLARSYAGNATLWLVLVGGLSYMIGAPGHYAWTFFWVTWAL